jgi:hypothetical protein
MSQIALQSLIGAALIDHDFCEELLGRKQLTLLNKFDLSDEERNTVTSIQADSIQEFAEQLHEWLKEREGFAAPSFTSAVSTQSWARKEEQEYLGETLSDIESFLVESLALGVLEACGIEKPPVPVREVIKHPLPIFKRLNLLELRLGLYDVAYRSLPNGSRVIVVDLAHPFTIQRAGVARELYVAFCRSSRAAELHWPDRKQPNVSSDFFARCLMMPTVWMQQSHADTTPLEDLATRFGVPIQMAAQRLNEIKQGNANTPR